MKKLLLIFTLLFSTLMFSLPSYAEWTEVSFTLDGKTKNYDVGETTFYVDFDTIRKHDGYVYYWDLANYLKPLKKEVFSSKIYWQGDCKLFRSKVLSDFYYSEPMGRGIPIISSNTPDDEWSYAPPNSSHEKILKSVCTK
jgi:hypothetical protein